MDELQARLEAAGNPMVSVRRLPLHINDPLFAEELTAAFLEVGGGDLTSSPQPPLDDSVAGIKTTAAAAAAAAALVPSRPSPPPDLDPDTPRGAILPGLYELVSSGRPIVGAGAGTGISAKCEEDGSANLIVIYNSGRFRMAGRGSLAGLLPFADANGVVVEMAAEVLPVVGRSTSCMLHIY